MVRPGWPRQTITARSSRQSRRFPHLINVDRIFGTHRSYNWRDGGIVKGEPVAATDRLIERKLDDVETGQQCEVDRVVREERLCRSKIGEQMIFENGPVLANLECRAIKALSQRFIVQQVNREKRIGG